MENKLLKTFTVTFLLSSFLMHSQNLKTKTPSFRYEILPKVVLPSDYKNYTLEVVDKSTDNMPLGSRYIFVRDPFINGMTNITSVNVQNVVSIGITIKGKTSSVGNPDNIAPSIKAYVEFNNIELVDKQNYVAKVKNQQTGADESFYSYHLSFKFSYRLKVEDVAKNKLILDTLIDIPRNTFFPRDYRYDGLGNKSTSPGYLNKPDLDIDYNKSLPTLYPDSKTSISENCMKEVKTILNDFFGYNWNLYGFQISKVKSKNPLFDNSEIAFKKMEDALDSITVNSKKGSHLNWHTNSIHNLSKEAKAIWEEMLSNEAYIKEFKNDEDGMEYIIGMKKNLIASNLLLDNFDKAISIYNEIEPQTRKKFLGTLVEDEQLKFLYNLIKREKYLYDSHKLNFNFVAN